MRDIERVFIVPANGLKLNSFALKNDSLSNRPRGRLAPWVYFWDANDGNVRRRVPHSTDDFGHLQALQRQRLLSRESKQLTD